MAEQAGQPVDQKFNINPDKSEQEIDAQIGRIAKKLVERGLKTPAPENATFKATSKDASLWQTDSLTTTQDNAELNRGSTSGKISVTKKVGDSWAHNSFMATKFPGQERVSITHVGEKAPDGSHTVSGISLTEAGLNGEQINYGPSKVTAQGVEQVGKVTHLGHADAVQMATQELVNQRDNLATQKLAAKQGQTPAA